MSLPQSIILIIFALISFFVSLKGVYFTVRKEAVFTLTPYLCWLGIFVWGDAVVFGTFWFLASVISYFLQNFTLFLLIISVFWLVRSVGETLYWFLQQFSQINRNPPHKLKGYKFFKNDSIWFIYQIIWQCITVISIITTIYLTNIWLKPL